MFFILSKILSFILSPLWWIAILLLLFLVLRNYRRRRILFYTSFTLLVVFSNQLLFYHVAGWWEGDLIKSEEVDACNGIILLGGFSSYKVESDRIRFSESADRLLNALELYHLKKADRFIFTGGSGRIIDRGQKEGEFLKDYLILMGIPEDSLMVEMNSRNTHENAEMTFAMLKEENLEKGDYLLVTSGFHMKRAMGCFKKAGLKVHPYNTDPLQSVIAPDFTDAITPSAGVLGKWQLLIREWIGYFIYKVMGYV